MEKYDSYKNSGVEWIGEIPSHWGTTRIKYTSKDDKYSFIDGDWIESKNLSDDGVRYITTGNIGEGKYKEQGKGYISEETFEKLSCTEIFEGDLIISRLSLPVGRSCILPHIHYKVVTSVDNVILRPKEQYNKYFLNYQFNSPRYFEYTELISRGVTLTRISRGMLGNNPVVIPPLSEQQQIVSFLDTKTSLIDSLIEKTQRKIELFKEKRTSLINEVVTKGLNPNVDMKDSGVEWIGEIPSHWETIKLKYQGEVIIGLSYSPENVVDEGEESTLVMRSSNVQNGKTSFNDNVFVNCDIPDKLRTRENDILICSRNGSRRLIGKNCLIPKEHEGLTWGVFMTVYRSRSPKFFYWLLNSPVFESQSGLFLTSTINQLTVSTLENMVVPFVSDIYEQQKIVEYLDEQTQKIDKTISIEEKRIELLKEYRQSLISEVVTGKRKVN